MAGCISNGLVFYLNTKGDGFSLQGIIYHPHPQFPGRLGFRQPADRFVMDQQNPPRIVQQDLALMRQSKILACPVEDPGTQAIFQPPNLDAHSGLAQADILSGLGEVSGSGDLQKATQHIDVDVHGYHECNDSQSYVE